MADSAIVKKGVLARVTIALIILLVFGFVFSSAVLNVHAFEAPTGSGSESGDGVAEEDTDIRSENPVKGYWLACIGNAPDSCNYFPSQEDEGLTASTSWNSPNYPVGIPNELFISDSEDNDYNMRLDLSTLYINPLNGFKNYVSSDNENKEIYKLKFVLEPDPFRIAGSNQVFGSHGGYLSTLKGLIDYYEVSYSCTTPLEDLDDCLSDYKDNHDLDVVDASAIEVSLLNHYDCSEFADLNGQFCEGVSGAGDNLGIMGVETLGIPSYGGCYVVDNNGNKINSIGRDWFFCDNCGNSISYDSVGDSPEFSPAFNYPRGTPVLNFFFITKVGRCCGNDPYDFGALINRKEGFENFFVCINNGSDGMWLGAHDLGNDFTLFRVDRPSGLIINSPNTHIADFNVSFDVVSNSDNWFICSGDNINIKNLYPGSTEEGPLVANYQGIPNPKERNTLGMTVGRSEDDDNGESTGSAMSTDDTEAGGTGSMDVIDISSFENSIIEVTSGPTQITPCDYDGDGYDGDWSDNAAYDCNKPPEDQKDCDDEDRNFHPGAIDYCDAEDIDYDCDPNSCITINNDPTPGNDQVKDPIFYVPRFICHDVDGYGKFSECCGWNTANCHNTADGRREGSAVNTLLEFPKIDATNFNSVLIVGVNKPVADYDDPENYFRLSINSEDFDEPFKDWRDYKNLEFDVYFTANFELEFWAGYLSKEDFDPIDDNLAENSIYPFKGRVVDYIVGEPRLRKWLHVIIPVNDIYAENKNFDVDFIVFASNIKRVSELGTSVTADIGGLSGPFSNVIGLDKIILRPKYEDLVDPDVDENYYCTGTWPPHWISDLDDTTLAESAEPLGMSACSAIPSYHWTGSACCGDDNGNNVVSDGASRIVGQFANKEFFSDSKGACWAGSYMANSTRVMIVQYNLSYLGNEYEVNTSCFNNSCTFPLPAIEGSVVTNPKPLVYDLGFVGDVYEPIGHGNVVESATTLLRADNVPLQIQYLIDGENNGDFYTCNAEEYLFDELQNTNTESALLTEEDHSFGSCEVKGLYYCDDPDGLDRGWDDTSLSAYPFKVEAGVGYANLTMLDGTSEEVQISEIYFPARRIDGKASYNLIKNGGFEIV